MAEKKDPSIYDDRSTIGSSDELDEYGVWVKSEPQDLSASLPDVEELPDMDDGFTGDLDLPDFSETEETEVEAEAEPLNFEFEEIPENADLPRGPKPTVIDKDGFTEVSMTDFLDSDLEIPESIDFGDLDDAVSDVEEQQPVTAAVPEAKPAEPAAAPSPASGAESLSTQLLMKIAEELSSIKQELSSLKSELAVVRGGAAEAVDTKGGGFFDEEDDEKIALTGDELDNILNTANFTEESGSDEALDEDLSLDLGPGTEEQPESGTPLSDRNDIIGESPDEEALDIGDISFNDADLAELDGAVKVADEVRNTGDDFDISLGLVPGFPDSGGKSDTLDLLREEGAAPITPAPEDTSYLEEDPLADISEEENIDLSGAVIDEPDLSAGITENPLSEPAIENISIDIDMEEQTAPEAFGSDDFVFEAEETMEIPSTEEPPLDDGVPLPDFSGSPSQDTFLPEEAFDFTAPEEGPESLIAPPEEAFPLPEETAPPEEAAFPEEAFSLPEGTGSPEPADADAASPDDIPSGLKQELKTVLSYMDQLLESLPDDKIEEFAKSEYFDTYKKLFEELGLV
ncbi:MAG: hypothetical protein LBK77_09280 [Spirochaetaceae bacterium]|jgi:hypothetical protein|nr:hypothetical protein [Spirochaetaceae bacterium]